MNRRQQKTLESIFARPTKAGIRWEDMDSMLEAIGCFREEGRGSRVRYSMGALRMVLHRPHPEPTLKKGAVEAVRFFLTQAGIKP